MCKDAHSHQQECQLLSRLHRDQAGRTELGRLAWASPDTRDYLHLREASDQALFLQVHSHL